MITDKARLVISRLNAIKDSRDGVDEATALEGLKSQLQKLVENISQAAFNKKMLSNQKVMISKIPELEPAIDNVQKVLLRFKEVPKSSTLRQGTRWTSFVDRLETLAIRLKTTQLEDWRTFCANNLFGGLPPFQRQAQLTLTPENIQAIERYKVLYQEYVKLRSNIPKNIEELNTLFSLSEQLAQVKFKEDIPDAVRKFIEATNTGAGLDLLTVEVIDWLRNNNLLSSYIVRAKHN